MPQPELSIWNERMLQLLAENPFATSTEWVKAIGCNLSNVRRIKLGTHSFTTRQMINAANLHKTTMDWICGLTETRTKTTQPCPIEMIEEGLRLIKASEKIKKA